MTTTILAAVAVFLMIVMLLVSLLLFAKAKLSPSGAVTLTINGEKVVEVAAGNTILTTLGEEKIFLPSACGGGGTCAMCKCQVFEGGGEILPTEAPYFSRKEIADNWRLGCQVKVKNDMKIAIPEEIFGIKKWECTVISNYNVASFIKEFVVQLPEGETLDFEAGGYIQVDVPPITVDFKDMDITSHPELGRAADDFRPEWDKFGLWDLTMKNDETIFRAYSMANHPAEGNIVMLNIRIATPPWDRQRSGWMNVNPGICSSFVFGCKIGDKVTISGPYGEFFIKETEAEMLYIGGGAGMAPMRSHLFHLFHTLRTNRKVTYWYGGRSKRELFYLDHFKNIEKEFPNFQFHRVFLKVIHRLLSAQESCSYDIGVVTDHANLTTATQNYRFSAWKA
jgi:Na+-transporting NADH:ubiquinone oxidoreductase subunit F